ncbi:MAG: histidine kinase [Acidobacteriia bacterium]|nr:histidine kinase [Terriglobia bacterium]
MIYYISVTAFLIVTAGFIGLGIAVYRRAPRNVEVKVLLLMLAIFSLQSMLLSLDALLFGIIGIVADQSHTLLSVVENSLQLFALGAVFHFVFLTFSRALDESGLLTDPFSQLQNYKGQYWFWVCVIYSLPLASIGKYTYLVFRSWQEHPSGKMVFPPMPSMQFFYAVNFFWFFMFTLRVVGLLYRKGPTLKKNTILDSLLALLGTYPKHDYVLHLGDYYHPGYKRNAAPASRDDWMACLVLSLWMLMFMVVGLRSLGGSIDLGQFSGMLGFLLPSVFVVPLIYYKMRFVFFDVLIKRGLIAVILLASVALYCGLILVPAYGRLASRSAAAGALALFTGTTLFMGVWLALYGRLNLMLDRHLFRRSDYGTAISEIDLAMKQFIEPEQLLDDVKNRLRSAVDAEDIEFVPLELTQSGRAPQGFVSGAGSIQRQLITAEIPVVAADRVYGVLRFGERTGRFRYQSEDLAFMTAVAGRLAEMLHNFELRSERVAQQQREEHLRALAQQSELRALRAQINPHFLFNALNSLADLTQEDPTAAESAILHLSHVFRYALDASRRESVILDEELSFVESYLVVERLRFEDRLRYEIAASAEARSCRTPPMLIQPVVENAVKHGISCKIDGGMVKINAAVADETLRIEIEDDGIGFDPRSLESLRRQGVGLENVRLRLEHVAGPGSMAIRSTPEGGTKVSLQMPAQRGEDPQ